MSDSPSPAFGPGRALRALAARLFRRADSTSRFALRIAVERLLANARLFLAVAALVAVYLDPEEPTLLVPLAYSILIAYALLAGVLLALLRAAPEAVVGRRILVHACDIAAAAIITVLTQGPSSPFFVFFIFVLLASALRWGVGPTMVTGAIAVTLLVTEAFVHAQLFGYIEVTRFGLRAAYLLVATVLLAQLAGAQHAFHSQSNLLSRMLARVRRGERLFDVVDDLMRECQSYFGARAALLAIEDDEADRWFCMTTSEDRPAPGTATEFVEIPAEQRKKFFFDLPADVAVWHISTRRDGSFRQRAATPDGSSVEWSTQEGIDHHARLLESYGARGCIAARIQLTNWHTRLFLFDPAAISADDLVFLHRIAAQVAPAVHSHYLFRRLRSDAGVVERARIARELHDGLIQSLLGLEMEIDVQRRTVGDLAVADELAALQRRLHDAVMDTRDLTNALRTNRVGRYDLLAELVSIVERFASDTGTDARLTADVDQVETPPRTASQVASILQEALVNVRRHAGAKHVLVRVSREPSGWKITIDDDGRGMALSGSFTLDELDALRRGPLVIKERVRAIGGQLALHSQPGRGSRLEVTWPFGRRYALGPEP